MKSIKIGALFFIMLLICSQVEALKSQYYIAAGLALQPQRNQFNIEDITGGQTHNGDTSLLGGGLAVSTGYRIFTPQLFMVGFEGEVLVVTSDSKRDINSGTVQYNLKNKSGIVNLNVLLGYMFKKTETIIYLKGGIAYRPVKINVQASGNTLDGSKNLLGFNAGLGVEFPLASNFSMALEGYTTLYAESKFNNTAQSLKSKVKARTDTIVLKLIFSLGRAR